VIFQSENLGPSGPFLDQSKKLLRACVDNELVQRSPIPERNKLALDELAIKNESDALGNLLLLSVSPSL
jgi:hypothetical protein